MQLTITIPDRLASRVEAWAAFTEQAIPDMVETALDVVLPPLPEPEPPVSSLSDEQLLELARVQMDPQLGERLTYLQRKQRNEELTPIEMQDLLRLMQRYNTLWVRQSQALALAVQRELMSPLSA